MRLAIVAVLTLLPVMAAAQEADQARQHARAGATAFALGNYSLAITEYGAAYQLARQPEMLFNLAQSYERSGQLQAAADRYETFLAWTGCPKDQPTCQRLLSSASERLQFVRGRLTGEAKAPIGPTAHIVINNSVSGGEPSTSSTASNKSEASEAGGITVNNSVVVNASPRRERPWYKRPVSMPLTVLGIATLAAGGIVIWRSTVYDADAGKAPTLPALRQDWDKGGAFLSGGVTTVVAGGLSLASGLIVMEFGL